jgi:hypothetical protein
MGGRKTVETALVFSHGPVSEPFCRAAQCGTRRAVLDTAWAVAHALSRGFSMAFHAWRTDRCRVLGLHAATGWNMLYQK